MWECHHAYIMRRSRSPAANHNWFLSKSAPVWTLLAFVTGIKKHTLAVLHNLICCAAADSTQFKGFSCRQHECSIVGLYVTTFIFLVFLLALSLTFKLHFWQSKKNQNILRIQTNATEAFTFINPRFTKR